MRLPYALAAICVLSATRLSIASEPSIVTEETWVDNSVQFLQAGTGHKNVNGGALGLCSENGMAMTGFTRSGKCEELQDDDGELITESLTQDTHLQRIQVFLSGSHHICIDLSTTSGGNFCEVTGQVQGGDNWCNDEGECFDNKDKKCPRKHWCVCQWAFAGYLKKAGGCDKIQDVVCTATNMAAMKAYESKKDSDDSIKAAHDCLKSKCSSS